MLAKALSHQQNLILIACDFVDTSYRQANIVYYSMYIGKRGYPVFTLDIEGDTSTLLNESRSLAWVDLDGLESFLVNPQNRLFILNACNNPDNFAKLRQRLGLPVVYEGNLELTAGDFATRRRYRGAGCLIQTGLFVDNIFNVAEHYASVVDFAKGDYSGVLLNGVANHACWQDLTRNSSLAKLPTNYLLPISPCNYQARPKRLRIGYCQTFNRFMAIENIKYMVKTQNPELYQQLEWVNLAEVDMQRAITLLRDCFAFICMDMATEYPLLAVEAMTCHCILLGWKGAFSYQSDLHDWGEFTPDHDYHQVARKVLEYASLYQKFMAQAPLYVAPLAIGAARYCAQHYSDSNLVKRFLAFLDQCQVELEGFVHG